MRVGIDVGGTFTDFLCIHKETGALTAWKVPSTPRREHEGLLDGLRHLSGADHAPEQIIHGTTVATNALLQRRGGKVALLTTAGFRDAIEIGRTRRNRPNSQFDVKFVKSEPLVDRPLRFELDERVGPKGEVIVALKPAKIASAMDMIAAVDPDAVAICFLNSYVNPAHEHEVKGRLAERLNGVALCTSSEVYPGFQESERFATTALNAYLMPLMAQYLGGLGQALAAQGIGVPLLVMGSNGGTISLATAAAVPVRTIVSGPAGGVIAATGLCEALCLDQVITYDMGGTSTDVCVIRGRQPLMTNQTTVDGLPLVGAMLEINTVGAGAGSIASVTEDGGLSVGPQSAGAEPGPVSYGFGGEDVTVTDANLVLGRLNSERTLGGRIHLDGARAREAIAALARKLGNIKVEDLAEGVIRIAITKMVGAVREISVERGIDPRGFSLIAYGGAGPMHAAFVAEELGAREVIVPRLPGNFSALGLLCADVRSDLVATVLARLDGPGVAAIRQAAGNLIAKGGAQLRQDGFAAPETVFETSVDMRYAGQAALFSVPLPEDLDDPEALRQLFLARYEERYGHANSTRLIEIEAVRITATGRVAKPSWSALVIDDHAGTVPSRRDVVFGGVSHVCLVFDRTSLARDEKGEGPAIVEEDGSTAVVPPGWQFRVDDLGNIRLTRLPS